MGNGRLRAKLRTGAGEGATDLVHTRDELLNFAADNNGDTH